MTGDENSCDVNAYRSIVGNQPVNLVLKTDFSFFSSDENLMVFIFCIAVQTSKFRFIIRLKRADFIYLKYKSEGNFLQYYGTSWRQNSPLLKEITFLITAVIIIANS